MLRLLFQRDLFTEKVDAKRTSCDIRQFSCTITFPVLVALFVIDRVIALVFIVSSTD